MIRLRFLPILFGLVLVFMSCQNDEVNFYSNVQIRVWQLEQPAVRGLLYNADTVDVSIINTEAQIFQFTSIFRSGDSIGIYFLTVPTEEPQGEFRYSILHDGFVLDEGSSQEVEVDTSKAQEALKIYVFE